MNHNADLVKGLINDCRHLERVDHASQAPQIEEYISNNIPFVVTGLADSWQTGKWTFDFFKAKYGHMKVGVRRKNYSSLQMEEKQMSMRDYINYVLDNEVNPEAAPFYSNTDFGPTAELLNDYEVPAYFKCLLNNLRGLHGFSPLSWIYIAPTNSMTHLHTDIGHSSAWNLVISGTKFWVFYPDDQIPLLGDGQLNPFNPDLDRFPSFANSNPMVCVQKPGEIVFTPGGMWHGVLNLEKGVSLTENFINKYNLLVVQKFCNDNNIIIPELNSLHL